MALSFPSTSSSPWTSPNGAVWTWTGEAWARTASGTTLVSAETQWQASTAYDVGDAFTTPFGESVVCSTAHTSGSTFDAIHWYFPGAPDGGTVVDFTRLPDGPTESIRPVYGQIAARTYPDNFHVQDGRFRVIEGSVGGGNQYFQVKGTDTIQHAWAVVDVSANPGHGAGFLLLLCQDQWFSGPPNRAAIHGSVMAKAVEASTTSRLAGGPYNIPAVTKSGIAELPYSFAGRQVRYDVTCDKLTGETRYYLDGVMVLNYVDPALIGYTSRFAILEFALPAYSVALFGTSTVLPAVLPDQPVHSSSIHTANSTLTAEYALIRTVKVKYGQTGQALFEWAPYITCTSGTVHFALGSASAGEPDALPTNKNRMCDATTNARVMFRELRTGTPGATENVGIYAKTTGVATIQVGAYGGTGVTVTPVGPLNTVT